MPTYLTSKFRKSAEFSWLQLITADILAKLAGSGLAKASLGKLGPLPKLIWATWCQLIKVAPQKSENQLKSAEISWNQLITADFLAWLAGSGLAKASKGQLGPLPNPKVLIWST